MIEHDECFAIPTIDDSDIAWVCGALGLPSSAFTGLGGADVRQSIIQSMDSLDIEAGPGSGKTTLLVAKLAILASKWRDRRRGLCVLSHTNVARREIETRLGNTAVGQSLLAYPHFIGTIHRFVNEFLALPWLRSSGYPIEMIDDEVCLGRRWQMLSRKVRYALDTNHHTNSVLRIKDVEFGLGTIRWGRSNTLGIGTPTYQEMRSVCEASAQEGYFCHDEMFVWADDMLDKMSTVARVLRTRFPVLFIDEVQDNSERQTELLCRIFIDGDRPVIRQRLGDSNQAIYQRFDGGQSANVGIDAFPIADATTDMPHSFRFDQSIADLANPLAVVPQGLRGLGERKTGARHVVFLFDEATIAFVLARYGRFLTELFSDSELREGSFVAVGAVHRPGGQDRVPRSVGHYWAGYDHEIGSREAQPRTFVQYVAAGEGVARATGESAAMVERVAEGVLRVARLCGAALKPRGRKGQHRWVLELLQDQVDAQDAYLDLVRTLCVDRTPLTRASWNETWRGVVVMVGAAMAGGGLGEGAVQEFLSWGEVGDAWQNADDGVRSNNVFRYSAGDKAVDIRVGSIHSVKGETHTGTLVLDTFFRAHHLKVLKGWLTGEKSGGSQESAAVQSRMRLHYVAMSRPSKVLCLAMRDDALTEADINKAIRRGWRVARITDGGVNWLDS